MKLLLRYITLSTLLCFTFIKGTAQNHDLMLMVSASKDTAKIGEDIIYVVRIKNEGKTNVTGVTARIWLSAGLKFASATPQKNTSYNSNSQIWTIGKINASQSYTTLYLRTTVVKDGVTSIFGEIISMNEKDKDSTPANNLFQEDDIEVKSVSVPMDFCLGEKIHITAKGALGFADYQWYKDGIAVKDSTDRQFTITAPGSYRYTVNGSVLGSCQGELCAPIIVRYRSDAVKLNITQPAPICANNTVIDLTSPNVVSATPSGGIFTYYNSLSDAKNNSNPVSLGLVRNTNTTKTYFVKYSLNGGCAAIDTVRAVVKPGVTALANASAAVTCLSSQVALNTIGSTTGTDITYKWVGPNNFTSTSTSPTVNAAGTYSLTVTNTKTGCSAVDTAVVKNSNYKVQVFAGNDTTIVKGKTVNLDAKVAGGLAPYKYQWLPPVGLSASNIANPKATPATTTSYNLIVTDKNGCQGADLIKITVIGTLANNDKTDTGNGTGNRSKANTYTMICESGNGLPMLDLTMRLKGETTGGTWSDVMGTAKNQFDTTTGLFNPNGLLSGTYTFQYTVKDGPEEIISAEQVSITIEQCKETKVNFPTTIIRN
jgi:uncharacterized repeat protein (TIGR01451 family)